MKLIIDTDVGCDDAAALILSLSYETSQLEILALTTVFGNVSVVEQAVANASRVLRLTQRTDIPIYAGASQPLIDAKSEHESFSSSEYHGRDGLGDQPDAEPRLLPQDFHAAAENQPAALAIAQLIRKYPGEITLVCLGPLTNVALALKLYPNIRGKLKNAVLMGGNIHATGNVLKFVSAEYNFYRDPEAAYIVLEELQSPITIVPWEAYLSHKADNDFIEKYYSERTPKSKFMKRITEQGLRQLKDWNWDLSFCDEAAMAVALNPAVVVRYEDHHATVELAGQRTRGQTVVNWKNVEKHPANVRFVTQYDVATVQEMCLRSVNC